MQRGIGAGIAIELGRRGADVILIYSAPSSEHLAQGIAERITSLRHHPMALCIRGDLGDCQTPSTIVDTAINWLRANGKGEKIHILVNNAGVELAKSLGDITPREFASVYDVNVRGTLLMTQAVLPYLATSGRIINLSSVGARASLANKRKSQRKSQRRWKRRRNRNRKRTTESALNETLLDVTHRAHFQRAPSTITLVNGSIQTI
ncbi:hypothetical protein BGZ61DRAFT_463402 [Ilyonectria robusta]|uniref:uncharacterized protein n=1 Tax=Ilyonectria robusta TaxID=1079257 RepID=UPI001E8DD2D6|nr:uncharacterized protein BGZ61DRAFT_463402 [Ilyonectria robusta]KAH8662796.1 hypothetical protein BGZ61DRAFT_463402 [Ilyonectria robusta]